MSVGGRDGGRVCGVSVWSEWVCGVSVGGREGVREGVSVGEREGGSEGRFGRGRECAPKADDPTTSIVSRPICRPIQSICWVSIDT